MASFQLQTISASRASRRRILNYWTTWQFDLAYQMLFARPPMTDEVASTIEFLNNARKLLSENGVAGEQIDTEAWRSCVRSLFRLNQFVYLE